MSVLTKGGLCSLLYPDLDEYLKVQNHKYRIHDLKAILTLEAPLHSLNIHPVFG